ncbi:hypothetical protein PsorP6_011918 [Peronosclerospora sorghi]|uniref:Uncharacterized protein n=1 Tax=Peronosclerospora sorghi TaxID=230839 RepID=A0ACC0WLP1_9STRA|nr:hypothetical protein PsorP6_011918 [Peronosclerospora sorghi]
MSSRRPSSSRTPPRHSSHVSSSTGKTQFKAKRRFLLKVTPIEAWDLLPADSGRSRNAYCTMVLLDDKKREIKGEKQRTPTMRHVHPVWSPLKAAVLRSLESHVESHQPLGIGAAAASEEYTFGIQTNLVHAKYVLVKCKDKGRVENEDLGRLLLSLEDMNTSGEERVAWYDLQLRPGGKMKRVQGKVRISSRIVREPSLWQLWTCAEQMRAELPTRDRSLYLKPHPNVMTGKEAVEWMLCHGLNRPMHGGVTCSTAEDALVLGTALLRNGIVMHVSGDRRFTNSTWKYYRFMVDHADAAVQQQARRQRELILSGEAEEVDDPDDDVVTRSMVASSVCNEEEQGLGRGRSEKPDAPPASSSRGQSKSTLKIDDFELLRVLGTGTYGRVVSARGPDGKVYAIKILTKIGMDATMRRNAKLERDMLREVRHPFVASLLFAFQNEDKVYMGMEFYNGGDLRHHLTLHQQGEVVLTPARMKLYAAELVAGLAHLHSLDIIYRDLKPENILIQADGHVVLVDFGLSTYANANDKKAHSLAGSPEYISPEVLAAATSKPGDPSCVVYDQACDWWSLGILIFEMYVGRTPFRDDNQAIMYRNIAEGFLYVPPELPDDVQSLLTGLIERNVAKRLGANEAVPFSIMRHAFFHGIDWDALQQKKMAPEWVPDVIDDADAKYVDNEFIHQVPVDTPEWRMLDSVDREREYFEDFTYRAPKLCPK